MCFMMLIILRETKTQFSCEITLILKCHRGHLGHSLGDTSGPSKHQLSGPPPHPFLPTAHLSFPLSPAD